MRGVSGGGAALVGREALHYLRKRQFAGSGLRRGLRTDPSGRLRTHLKRLLADPTNADGFFCDRM